MTEEVKNSPQHKAEMGDTTKKAKCYFAEHKNAAYAAFAVIGLIVGLLIGSFFLGGPASPLGETQVPASKLDETIATYKYNGNHTVTIRELMEAQGNIDLFKTVDPSGNEVYRVPGSETALSYVRSQILMKFADSKGIKVSNEEVLDTIRTTYGVEGDDNIASLAKQFGTTPEKLKELVAQQLKSEKLVKSLLGDENLDINPPAKPEKPEGDESKATEKYAEYIRNTVGDAWNQADGKWANENSPYAMTLVGDNAFNGKTATYSQANTVYSIAVQQFQEEMGKKQAKAIDEINKVMASSSVTVRTLAQ